MTGIRWERLGGATIVGDISVARNLDGRLEIFARRDLGEVIHNWQTTPGPGSPWSGWNILSGGLGSGGAVAAPIARINAQGKIVAFAHDSVGGLKITWQITPGGTWTNWSYIYTAVVSHFDVATDLNGRLVLFTRRKQGLGDTEFIVARQSDDGSWAAGQQRLSVIGYDRFVVGCNADGRMEVFSSPSNVMGTAGNVTHFWEVSPGGNWSDSLRSRSLGGAAEGVAQDIVLATSQNGCLYLFGSGSRGEVAGKDVYIYQTSPSNGWAHNAGAPMWSTHLESMVGKPVVIRDVSGALQVFVATANRGIKQISQMLPNSDSWSQLGLLLGGRDLVPRAAALNKYGALELFATNSGGEVFHTWQTTAGGPWIYDEPAILPRI